MKSKCNTIIESYLKWLRENTDCYDENQCSVIITPFLDRHNDHLEILARKEGEHNFVLSDGAYIITDLENSGFSLSSEKRKEILKTILNGYGVKLDERTNELKALATPHDLGKKKHNLLQAMLAINDLFVLSKGQVQSLFKEDVEKFLLKNKVPFNSDMKIAGKSGYDHLIDFALPASDKYSERLIKTVNKLNKDAAEQAMFTFIDISEVRKKPPKSIVIFNDEVEHEIQQENISALLSYSITPVPWSKRKEQLEMLKG